MDASGFLPEGVPSNWRVYWEVDDVDAAIATVTGLGGSVLMPAQDTPYGRLAQVADPAGAAFNLRKPPARPEGTAQWPLGAADSDGVPEDSGATEDRRPEGGDGELRWLCAWND